MRPFLYYIVAGIVLLAACSEDEPGLVDLASPPDTTNAPPTVVIEQPVDLGTDPTSIFSPTTLVVAATDSDNPPADLSVRWALFDVERRPFNQDWDAVEDSLSSNPDWLYWRWSDWETYTPSDGAMQIVADSLQFGFHLLCVQARDTSGALSELNDDSMRRVLVDDGVNDAPVVKIHFPPSTPITIGSDYEFRFEIIDLDDLDPNLTYRWAMLNTFAFGSWEAAEQVIINNTEWVAWSDWSQWLPRPNGGMAQPLSRVEPGAYIITVQARDASGNTSVFDGGSLRRANVEVCPADLVVISPAPYQNVFSNQVTISFDHTDVIARFYTSGFVAHWAVIDVGLFNDSWGDAFAYLLKDPVILAQYGKTEADADAEWSEWIPVGYVEPTQATVGPLYNAQYLLVVQGWNSFCVDNEGPLIPGQNVRVFNVSAP